MMKKYTVEDKLGVGELGGFGKVYLGRHIQTNEKVVLKYIERNKIS